MYFLQPKHLFARFSAMVFIIIQMLILGSTALAAETVAAATAATAATPASVQHWWMPLAQYGMETLGFVLATLILAGIAKLIKIFEAKTKIEVPLAVENLVKERAALLIAAAEEKAENRLLHGDGIRTPGVVKCEEVVEQLLKFVNKLGYGAEWQKEKLTEVVNGLLHLNRTENPGVGSVGTRLKILTAKEQEAQAAAKAAESAKSTESEEKTVL